MVTKTEYLYGDIEPPEIPADIIMRRVEILTDRLEVLLEHSYHTRDTVLVNRLIKAIKFWENINNDN